MPLTTEAHEHLARRLFEAEVSARSIADGDPEFAALTLADAYAVQAEIASLKESSGIRQLGWKTMGTNAALRNSRGAEMTEPGRGYLFESALSDDPVSIPSGHNVFAEPEISFILQGNLNGPGVTAEDVLSATKEICASIEVAWSRFDGRPPTFSLVADNAGAARVVLSSRRASPFDVGDMARISVEFLKNGEVVQTGTGEDVHGSPANAVAWLANHLAQSGLGLKAGQVILAGSFTFPVAVASGDSVTARFEKLGDLHVRFS